MLKPQGCLLLLLVPSGNRIAACRSGVQGGRSLGLMVVQFLELSQNPLALLANKILIRRKKKIKCYGQLRCCPLFCSKKGPDLKAQCSESRWRARYLSGHCFKGAKVEDQAAILVATCVG